MGKDAKLHLEMKDQKVMISIDSTLPDAVLLLSHAAVRLAKSSSLPVQAMKNILCAGLDLAELHRQEEDGKEESEETAEEQTLSLLKEILFGK